MQKKTSFLVLVLVLVVLIGGAYVLYGRLSAGAGADNLSVQTPPSAQTPGETGAPQDSAAPEETERPKVEAPDFTAVDADGTEVKLSDYVGKPIVLNFWASWCSPCKSEMPEFNAAWEELDGEVQFLMVNATDGNQETLEKAQDYVAEQGFTFPVLYDTELEAMYAYQVSGLPVTYFVASDGTLAARGSGMMDLETLEQGIALIAE